MIKRREGENAQQYLWRIGNLKDAGVIEESWNDLAEISRLVVTLVEHLRIVDIRYPITGIDSSAIGSVLISVPSPQDALYEADVVKTKCIYTCVTDHSSSVCSAVIGIVRGVANLIYRIESFLRA